jgi:hypothetical protein
MQTKPPVLGPQNKTQSLEYHCFVDDVVVEG